MTHNHVTNDGRTNSFNQNISLIQINSIRPRQQRASTDSLKTMRGEEKGKDELQLMKLNTHTHMHTHTHIK